VDVIGILALGERRVVKRKMAVVKGKTSAAVAA
jgi:hypothetical protein